MTLFKSAWRHVQHHRTAFIVLNVAFYAILAFGMAITMAFPQLKDYANAFYDLHHFELPIMTVGLAAYSTGNVAVAAAVTFFVNISVALVLTIIPSLIVPFIGIAAVFYRVILWGGMFSPFGFEAIIFVPHMPTVLLEGFAYVLAAFAAYVHGVRVIHPARYGYATRWDAYKGGLKPMGTLLGVVVLILIVAAIYEALEVIYWVPVLLNAALQSVGAL
ncbi:hypothetical protein [Devosia epidermidihirudinis]|uniref:hypothetical protein n=1 Tax=Devosia epidermidihirudinis TaxID=1293439 RepID=UPI000695E1B2|nr:hypothetical protein [Devosia epidermidihirudinis]